MKTLVVAVNEAPTAITGVRYAAQLAPRLSAELCLTYVSPPLPRLLQKSDVAARLVGEEQRYVADFLTDIARELKVPLRHSHVRGHPVREFLAQLAEKDTLMGVIGPAVHKGVGRMLFGGFAWRVAVHAPRPVLIARGDPADLPLADTRGRKVPLYLVGYDDSAPAKAALATAVELAAATGASLCVLAIVEPVIIGDSFTIPSELVVAEQLRADAALTSAQQLVNGRVVATYATFAGAPGLELAERARKLGASLIVIGDTGRGRASRAFLGSTADRLLNLGDRSTLIVHAQT